MEVCCKLREDRETLLEGGGCNELVDRKLSFVACASQPLDPSRRVHRYGVLLVRCGVGGDAGHWLIDAKISQDAHQLGPDAVTRVRPSEYFTGCRA